MILVQQQIHSTCVCHFPISTLPLPWLYLRDQEKARFLLHPAPLHYDVGPFIASLDFCNDKGVFTISMESGEEAPPQAPPSRIRRVEGILDELLSQRHDENFDGVLVNGVASPPNRPDRAPPASSSPDGAGRRVGFALLCP